MMTNSKISKDQRRARAALWGIAIGDAFGKMTEGYWPPDVKSHYGGPVEEFVDPIPTNPDRAGVWTYAEVTDDTRLTVLVAESIIAKGGVDEAEIVSKIVAAPVKGWPGWEELRQKAPRAEWMNRTGNGAPIRVCPIGIINGATQIEQLTQDVYACCRCSHGSKSALAAANAIAAAFAGVFEEMDKPTVLEVALQAAILGDRLGTEDYLPSVPRRIEWLRNVYLKTKSKWKQGLNPGFPAWEGAIFALYLFLKHDSAKEAIVEAANSGGDADSIASMSGGLLAARHPESLPQVWQKTVQERNDLDLDTLADALVRLRGNRASNNRMHTDALSRAGDA